MTDLMSLIVIKTYAEWKSDEYTTQYAGVYDTPEQAKVALDRIEEVMSARAPSMVTRSKYYLEIAQGGVCYVFGVETVWHNYVDIVTDVLGLGKEEDDGE